MLIVTQLYRDKSWLEIQLSRIQIYYLLQDLMWTAAAAAKLLQSCPTLCDPIDRSPPASIVPGILQARTLEWVAISFSNALKWKVKVKSLSHVRLLGTPWTAAHQAPPSMGFSRQEYWSGVPLPSPMWTMTLYSYKDLQSFLSADCVIVPWSETLDCACVLSPSVVVDSLQPHRL